MATEPMQNGAEMDLRSLKETPSWDWPEDAGEELVRILRNPKATPGDRLLAAEFAGDCAVVDETLVDALVTILGDRNEPEQLRARAAISLGPVLEEADEEGFDEPDQLPINEQTIRHVQDTLRRLVGDRETPHLVRRRALEASVRAPQDWHEEAIRTASASRESDWRLTGVFCMRFVPGFEDDIVAALANSDPDIHCEAVYAAGAWAVQEAWDHVVALLDTGTERSLLLAAIDAVANIRPDEAEMVLGALLDVDDEEIVEATKEAIAMAEEAGAAEDER